MDRLAQKFSDNVNENIAVMKKGMSDGICLVFNDSVVKMLEALIVYFPLVHFPFAYRFREALTKVVLMMQFNSTSSSLVEEFCKHILFSGLYKLINQKNPDIFNKLRENHDTLIGHLFDEAQFQQLWPEIPADGKEMIWSHFQKLVAVASPFTFLMTGEADEVLQIGARFGAEYKELCAEKGIQDTMEGCQKYVIEKTREFCEKNNKKYQDFNMYTSTEEEKKTE